MKRAVARTIFKVLAVAWFGFVSVDLIAHTIGDCNEGNAMCAQLKEANRDLVALRGFVSGIVLCIAFAVYWYFFEDRDVH